MAKRGSPLEDEMGDTKRPRNEEPKLHVYEPCVLLPVAQRIGSLVEVHRGCSAVATDMQALLRRLDASIGRMFTPRRPIQVLLPARYLSCESKAVKQRRLWGARLLLLPCRHCQCRQKPQGPWSPTARAIG